MLQGAHSIQSICMGHSIFAKCCSFVCPDNAEQPVLLSGGGDSSVRSACHCHRDLLWVGVMAFFETMYDCASKNCKLRKCGLKGSVFLSCVSVNACQGSPVTLDGGAAISAS